MRLPELRAAQSSGHLYGCPRPRSHTSLSINQTTVTNRYRPAPECGRCRHRHGSTINMRNEYCRHTACVFDEPCQRGVVSCQRRIVTAAETCRYDRIRARLIFSSISRIASRESLDEPSVVNRNIQFTLRNRSAERQGKGTRLRVPLRNLTLQEITLSAPISADTLKMPSNTPPPWCRRTLGVSQPHVPTLVCVPD